MAANGRVITGYSHPVYSVIQTTRTCEPLARGVDVSATINSTDEVKFYADNGVAETAGGGFTDGTLSLTVDGLKAAAIEDLYSRTASSGWTVFKSTDAIPYVSVGFIVRFMEDGVTSYVPVIFNKVKFSEESLAAATQSETIEFQTQSLEAKIFEDDAHVWKYLGDEETTEAAAITALETKIVTV